MTGSRAFVRGACAAAALLAHVAAALPAVAVPASGMDAIVGDWLIQDAGRDAPQVFKSAAAFDLERRAVDRAMEDAACDTLAAQRDALVASKVPGNDPRWRELYVRVCEARRRERLARLVARYPRIVFTKHYNLGGSHYAYTEGQSDAQAERHFVPGAALCVLSTDGMYGTVDVLLEDPNGVIRDPDVSYDGTRILFAWKKSLNEDDYHLYEMDVATRAVRQLTFGLGFADYEGVYLPGGDIMFNSTRCVQTVDCWWTEVSNLYVCDGDGRYLRRVGFDQVHTNYPQVLEDGRVIYTRWDYNDRGQIYPQPLFVMNPDGTGQREYYGNNSWWPTTVGHARGIPGSEKLIAIATGHHSIQTGALIVIDARKGRQETSGATLVAPRVDDKSDRRYRRVDAYVGFDGHFMYPYPLCEKEYIVSYSAHETRVGSKHGYALYLVREDGARELLAHDPDISCNQPVPLAPRPLPLHRADMVDYRRTTGTYYAQDIYAGEGLRDVPRGTIKKLRVVALDYRAAGVGSNGNNGPAGGALVSTPVAIDNGTWDVKIVLGEAQVHADGSVFFEAPARTPLYFQAVDARGFVAQSMRTWSTLMPGENMSCVGCHDAKSSVPPAAAPNMTLALAAGPQELDPFYGPPRGFSFRREIQPILDRHCVGCHKEGPRAPEAKGRSDRAGGGDKSAFSLRDATGLVSAGRAWSEAYLALTLRGKPHRVVHWLNVQSVPPMLPPYTAGSASSELMTMLEAGH